MNSLAQSTGNSAKSLAQQIAKQMAKEPVEILKDVRKQTIGGETMSISEKQVVPQNQEVNNSKPQGQMESQDKMKAVRRMEALNRELEDMGKQEKFKELQERISQGEEIPLEDYPELSMEQKQVLKAQMEAVKKQIEIQKTQSQDVLIEPAVKKGRQLFNFGKKQSMKNEQTRVEKPVPPSG